MPVRVLVVDDSLTVRKHLCEVLAAAPDVEVIGEAGDGKRAIELCQSLRPDVVTMDMMLPVMTGLSATEYIMAHCPTPILIVSASVNRGELFRTYDALAAGAVDVLDKPDGDETSGTWERTFVDTVKLVSRIRVITHLRARLRPLGVAAAEPEPAPRPSDGYELAAIGSSTGGPGAIVDLLHALPPSFEIPLVLVLHIGDPFATAFGDWLDGQTRRRVAYAKDGQPLAELRGRMALAPPGHHLIVANGRLRLVDGPERHSCRPAVDVLFESVAREHGARAVGVLLTGMGRDGALGLLQMRSAGAHTIAQDEGSSVVYGMPREAAALGAAMRILPLAEIGPALVALERPRVEGRR